MAGAIRQVHGVQCGHGGGRLASSVAFGRRGRLGGPMDASQARSRPCGRLPHQDRWSRHSDLNRGPAVYETAALPLSYVGAAVSLAARPVLGSPRFPRSPVNFHAASQPNSCASARFSTHESAPRVNLTSTRRPVNGRSTPSGVSNAPSGGQTGHRSVARHRHGTTQRLAMTNRRHSRRGCRSRRPKTTARGPRAPGSRHSTVVANGSTSAITCSGAMQSAA